MLLYHLSNIKYQSFAIDSYLMFMGVFVLLRFCLLLFKIICQFEYIILFVFSLVNEKVNAILLNLLVLLIHIFLKFGKFIHFLQPDFHIFIFRFNLKLLYLYFTHRNIFHIQIFKHINVVESACSPKIKL